MARIAEQRFTQGTGVRYLKNGKVRCHACAEYKVRAIREREGDPTLDPDECWPEAQCGLAAAPGSYTCAKWHGGGGGTANLVKVAGTTLLGEFMPVNLARKFQKFVHHSQLIDNYEDLALLHARQAMLLERQEELIVGEQGWMAVEDAINLIREGEYAGAIQLLETAKRDHRAEGEIQEEIRANMSLMDKIRRTNLHIEEKQGSMIFRDEYLGTLDLIFKTVATLLKKYLGEGEANAATAEFADAIIRITSAGAFVNRKTVEGQTVQYTD